MGIMAFIELFKFMFSIPRTKPMTNTEKFIQWSCPLTYVLGGITFFIAPNLLKILLQLDFDGRSEGYIRLMMFSVPEIAFLILIAARSNHKDSHHLEILGSVIERLLVVNGMLVMMILRNMVPCSFALFFIALDTCHAFVTLVIWYIETDAASASLFFREIFVPILQGRALKAGGSAAVVFCLEIAEMFFWLVLVIKPEFAQQLFHLEPFEGFSGGYLACVFFVMAILSWDHVTGSSNINRCLNSAYICYRILFSVPVLSFLFLAGQIEKNLAIALVISNVIPAVIIGISVSCEDGNKNKRE